MCATIPWCEALQLLDGLPDLDGGASARLEFKLPQLRQLADRAQVQGRGRNCAVRHCRPGQAVASCCSTAPGNLGSSSLVRETRAGARDTTCSTAVSV